MTKTWPAACTFAPIEVAQDVRSTKSRSPWTLAASAGPVDPRRWDCSPTRSRRSRPGADGEYSLAPVASANCGASPACRGASRHSGADAGEDAADLVGGRHGAAAPPVGNAKGERRVQPVLVDLGIVREARSSCGPAGAPARPTARRRETSVGHYGRGRGAGSGGVTCSPSLSLYHSWSRGMHREKSGCAT